MNKIIEEAFEAWLKQGRDFEHIYGVRNFLSGLGGTAIKELEKQAHAAGATEERERLEKILNKVRKPLQYAQPDWTKAEYHNQTLVIGNNNALNEITALLQTNKEKE